MVTSRVKGFFPICVLLVPTCETLLFRNLIILLDQESPNLLVDDKWPWSVSIVLVIFVHNPTLQEHFWYDIPWQNLECQVCKVICDLHINGDVFPSS
jgi:hypothetical protein